MPDGLLFLHAVMYLAKQVLMCWMMRWCFLFAGEKEEFECELENYKAQHKMKVTGITSQSKLITERLLSLYQ